MTEEHEDLDNVIDLMAVRIERAIDEAQTAEEFDVATTLYEMYTEGEVEVTMKEGQLFFQYVGDEPFTFRKEDAR